MFKTSRLAGLSNTPINKKNFNNVLLFSLLSVNSNPLVSKLIRFLMMGVKNTFIFGFE